MAIQPIDLASECRRGSDNRRCIDNNAQSVGRLERQRPEYFGDSPLPTFGFDSCVGCSKASSIRSPERRTSNFAPLSFSTV